jgi:trehalose 6-phosphate phosphatase
VLGATWGGYEGVRPILRLVELPPLLARLAMEPATAALLLDVDGTLAPIVDRPEDSAVPSETRAELERLRERYGLVACISGRSGAEAERIVGVDGLRYVGSHGLELAPEADAWADRLRDFSATVDWPVEDKRLTVSFHWRTADDQEAAQAYLETVAGRAREAGHDARFGRKVLELRPPVRADKGTAVAALLAESGLRRALYAGDDTTDADAFRAVHETELGVAVAVRSPEAPYGLEEQADVVVDGTAGVLDLLRSL